MIKQGKVKTKVFSIWLGRYSDSGKKGGDDGGEITFGGINTRHFTGTHTYVPVEGNKNLLSMYNILVGKKDTKICSTGCKAIVDSGTSNILGPPELIAKINQGIFAARGCLDLSKLPAITFTIAGKLFPLKPSDTIGNLKWMDLFESRNLKELPDLSTAINLRKLNICKCSSLEKLPFSIGNMTNLHDLDLTDCSSLMELPFSIGNMTNLEKLNLYGCSSLLPFSIGNMTNLKKLNLYGCSSLVELPSSIGNMINLRNLDLEGCLSLVELPSSIGNMTNLTNLDLEGCLSLVELPSSMGNMTNVRSLYLTGSASFVELTSSIGNLHNLQYLCLNGCSKLKALPNNINIKSLDELDLSDCSLLKSFPEISTNIRVLTLNGTAVEEVHPSIRSWSRLERLHMSYSEDLIYLQVYLQHAFDLITELHLSDTRIQEVAPWVKEMSCLHKLVTKGCTKLVSLPQLPDSLQIIDAENCESLERLDCVFKEGRQTVGHQQECSFLQVPNSPGI
ncbi:disease resistance protein TAO1-like [Brassica napus]|uniref:disease resistance protein TAO1-like n=1 Tax=Brassica napus TaxID=3708 RepID=UPI00207A2BAC|nr:disease resistance protein TAO1-like [Brassica napus]